MARVGGLSLTRGAAEAENASATVKRVLVVNCMAAKYGMYSLVNWMIK